MSIPVIILAGGTSSRLGQPKQLVPFNGKPLIDTCAQAAMASVCHPVLIVLGRHACRIREQVQGQELHFVDNRDWSEGIASSIRAGLRSALELDATIQAVVFSVADQPFIAADNFDALVEAYQHGSARIVASAYSGTLGVPALFDRFYFQHLSQLKGDVGAKKIILQHKHDVASVEFPEGSIDIDRAADLAAIAEHPQP